MQVICGVGTCRISRDGLHVLGLEQTLQIIVFQYLPIHSAVANLCRLIQPLLTSLSEFLADSGLVPSHLLVVKVGKYGKW